MYGEKPQTHSKINIFSKLVKTKRQSQRGGCQITLLWCVVLGGGDSWRGVTSLNWIGDWGDRGCWVALFLVLCTLGRRQARNEGALGHSSLVGINFGGACSMTAIWWYLPFVVPALFVLKRQSDSHIHCCVYYMKWQLLIIVTSQKYVETMRLFSDTGNTHSFFSITSRHHKVGGVGIQNKYGLT